MVFIRDNGIVTHRSDGGFEYYTLWMDCMTHLEIGGYIFLCEVKCKMTLDDFESNLLPKFCGEKETYTRVEGWDAIDPRFRKLFDYHKI